MKKILIIAAFMILGQWITAQDRTIENSPTYEYKNVMKLSPVELVRAEFQLGYERYFNNRNQSLAMLLSVISGQNGSEVREGLQVFAQYRFYLSHLHKETHQTFYMYNIGFYTAPYLLGLTYQGSFPRGEYMPNTGEYVERIVDEKINSMEIGALMGIQFDITSRIVLDLFLGGGVRRSQVESNDTEENYLDYGLLDLGYTGVKPRIGMQMGITF